MLTKKNFEAIAHVLDANRADLALVGDFADMCQEDNPNFNRMQFVTAATLNLRIEAESVRSRIAVESVRRV